MKKNNFVIPHETKKWIKQRVKEGRGFIAQKLEDLSRDFSDFKKTKQK